MELTATDTIPAVPARAAAVATRRPRGGWAGRAAVPVAVAVAVAVVRPAAEQKAAETAVAAVGGKSGCGLGSDARQAYVDSNGKHPGSIAIDATRNLGKVTIWPGL